MANRSSFWTGREPSYDEVTGVYSPSEPSGWKKIGTALQGIAAPYLGDFDFALKQAKLQQQANEADMEFRRYQAMTNTLKPIYTMDPITGQPTLAGIIPKGGAVVTNPNAPTADQKNMMKATQQAQALFKDIKSRSESLKGGYSGAYEIGKAALNRGKGESSKYRTYLSNLPATAVSLYRSLTGDTRLSDADAQSRAMPFLWHPSEHTDVRKDKNTFLDKMLSAREELLSSGNYPTGEIPLDDIVDKAKEVTQEGVDDGLLNQYMKKYPNRSKDEILNAMKKQGLIKNGK